MSDIIIPQVLQIVVDDLGWFCGDDDRENGGASRSGMPRRHCHKDYEALNRLGEALDQKIFCAFCLSEWDPDNRMKRFPTISKYGKSWDNVKYLDKNEAEKCAEVINNSPYIDFALHGMGHGYYSEDNECTDRSDYYKKVGKMLVFTGEEYIRGILDSFFEIKEYYGINKEVTCFVPPSGAYRLNELSKILADYGIKYVSTPLRFAKCEGEKPADIFFEGEVITMDRYMDITEWDQHSIDYSELPKKTETFGSHWPNWLHLDPDRNDEVIKSAVKYFYKCAEDQSTIISRDMRFCITQTMFWKFATLTENTDGSAVIDVTNVPRHENMNDVFYINSRFPLMKITGGTMTEYDRKKGFVTYEIKPTEHIIRIK